jgi:alpha-N-arabinofuranosidase
MTFTNPVIRGYYPDPSVCRAGGKYYLVASSFQYFPGVPLFESTDLVNWKQIGHCLTRSSQLPLDNAYSSGGIFAPTIRHNSGRFYMATTNVTGGGNFYVYTDDIYGEWSEPIYVEQEGIDPSLYFEGDRAYFMSNGQDKDRKPAIIQSEINIETGELLSEVRSLWGGTGGRYLESPHLYKIGGYYYLTAAEGGTEYGHMVTYARSKDMWGPYEPYAGNPVLTNRNLGGYPIQGIGHADLIDDEQGNWWILHLGFRQIDRWLTFHHLGRETFLMPVDFGADGWFTAGENGTTTVEVNTERIPANVVQEFKNEYTFENTEAHEWRFIRKEAVENFIYDTEGERRVLKIRSSPHTLNVAGNPSFVGLHQKEFNMKLSVKAKVLSGEAGVTVYMDENHHYDISVVKYRNNYYAKLKLNIGDIKFEQTSVSLKSEQTTLIIKADAYNYGFFICEDGEEINLGQAQTRYLSSEVAGGFTGVVLGLYSQNGKGSRFNEFRAFRLTYKQ